MAVTPEPNMTGDLERDPRLEKAYRAGAHEEPPAHLDAAIRAAARRAVGAGPVGAMRFRNWSVPLSLAAVVVLSVTVVTMMRDEGGDRWEAPSSPAMTEKTAPLLPEAVPELGGNRLADRLDQAIPAEPQQSATLPGASRPAPARVAPEPALPPAAEMAQRARKSAAPRAKIAADEVARAEEDKEARRERMQSAPTAAPQPQLRSAPPASGDTAAGYGSTAESSPPVAALTDAPQSRLWKDLIHQPPEKWIQRITELHRAGKTADADALAVEFRRRFPGERLPVDVR